MLTFPAIDPVAIHLGPLAIRWYALAYLAGVFGGWFIIQRLNRRHTPFPLSPQAMDDLMVYAIFGIIAGGRLGYVLFYKPGYYLSHPLEIVMLWQGGMSFHGGCIGMALAMLTLARKHKFAFLSVTDLIATVAPLGLFFGRLANFINGELFGRVTDSPIGIIFPQGGPEPRHPSQLYEAGLEGLLLLLILLLCAFRFKALRYPGLLSGLFLVGYSLTRSFAEFFREPDSFLGFLPGGITMGQLLCIPMFILGVYLIKHHGIARRPH